MTRFSTGVDVRIRAAPVAADHAGLTAVTGSWSSKKSFPLEPEGPGDQVRRDVCTRVLYERTLPL